MADPGRVPVRLVRDGRTGKWRVEVAGHRIENDVRGIAINAVPSETLVTLDLHTARADLDVAGDALVRVDNATYRMLVDLGWTPPDQPPAPGE